MKWLFKMSTALGFTHMHTACDRDDYVTIHLENIRKGMEHNFVKEFASDDLSQKYDYESIMHYSARAFSSNGKLTIVPKVSEMIQCTI